MRGVRSGCEYCRVREERAKRHRANERAFLPHFVVYQSGMWHTKVVCGIPKWCVVYHSGILEDLPGAAGRSEGMSQEQIPAKDTLGHYLREARFARGLEQEELAARCDLRQVDISRFELGQRQPSWQQLLRLSEALPVPLQLFLTGTVRPGAALPDLLLELAALGVRDLAGQARVPGAFRASEEVVALVLAGNEP